MVVVTESKRWFVGYGSVAKVGVVDDLAPLVVTVVFVGGRCMCIALFFCFHFLYFPLPRRRWVKEAGGPAVRLLDLGFGGRT